MKSTSCFRKVPAPAVHFDVTRELACFFAGITWHGMWYFCTSLDKAKTKESRSLFPKGESCRRGTIAELTLFKFNLKISIPIEIAHGGFDIYDPLVSDLQVILRSLSLFLAPVKQLCII